MTALRKALVKLVNLLAVLHDAGCFLKVLLVNEGIVFCGVFSKHLAPFVVIDSVGNQPCVRHVDYPCTVKLKLAGELWVICKPLDEFINTASIQIL